MLPSNTPKYSLEAVNHTEASRATESTAIKIMHDRYLDGLERSVNAIEFILNQLNEEDKTLVDLVYWKGAYTIEGAGMELNMSRRTTYRHIDVILTALAKELGFIPI